MQVVKAKGLRKEALFVAKLPLDMICNIYYSRY